MSTATGLSYDEIPYEGFAQFETHPDHLAALASLFGVSSPEVGTARVLEVGCARGDNLIPMAVSLPMARFVGIDVSQRQIEEGRATIAALGLTNVELLATSITDVTADLGSFDYIIAHGIYSWVSDLVQERLLGLCAERLAPDGLAYISYNTYPGWHIGTMVRDMMLFYTRSVTENKEKVRASRAFLQTLAQLIAKYDNPYLSCLQEEAELIQGRPDFYIHHEYLVESFEPVHFHEFVERAAAHGLQYLAEAKFKNMAIAQSPELLRSFGGSELDWLTREQYLDFVTGQSFRQSVLCRDQKPCSRTPSARALMSLRITVNVRPSVTVPCADPGSDVAEEFQVLSGNTVFSTGDPLLKTMLRVLWEALPKSLPFETLRSGMEARLSTLGETSDAQHDLMPAQLAEALLSCLGKGLIDLHVREPAYTTEINEFPRASPVARRQAVDGMRVANLRQQAINLIEFDRFVLSHLDGRQDRRALVAELHAAAANGVFTMQVEGQPVTDPREVDHLLTRALEESLGRLATRALLL
jgi:methyltransferase-like protein/2-polyprenyl-3-methyl-5-hydroxy-6-metoxy-1,4-benzoquinol methylase